MGITSKGWWLRISLADNGANVTTKRYQLTAATAIQVALDVPDIIAALDLITNSVIISYAYGEEFGEDTIVYPAEGIENENKASLTVNLANKGGKKANLKVPAPVIGIFQGASGPSANIVDALDLDLLEYVALFEAAGQCYISDGESVDILLSGKRISKGSNQG